MFCVFLCWLCLRGLGVLGGSGALCFVCFCVGWVWRFGCFGGGAVRYAVANAPYGLIISHASKINRCVRYSPYFLISLFLSTRNVSEGKSGP